MSDKLFSFNQNQYNSYSINHMGVPGYLALPLTDKTILTGKTQTFYFCSIQMQGWRSSLEDRIICEQNLGDGNSLFGIFDGHGGTEVAEFVKDHFRLKLLQTHQYKQRKYKEALLEAYFRIDEVIQSQKGKKELSQIKLKYFQATFQEKQLENLKQEIDSHSFCGCTANVLLITPDAYFSANIGNSRSVLLRSKICIEMSNDHLPQNPEEQNRIKKAGGTVQYGRVNGCNNISRSFGDFYFKQNHSLKRNQQLIICEPDIKQFKKDIQDQMIILGSDGIWQRFKDDSSKLCSLINSKLERRGVEEALNQIFDDCLGTGLSEQIGLGNMSMILINFHR